MPQTNYFSGMNPVGENAVLRIGDDPFQSLSTDVDVVITPPQAEALEDQPDAEALELVVYVKKMSTATFHPQLKYRWLVFNGRVFQLGPDALKAPGEGGSVTVTVTPVGHANLKSSAGPSTGNV